MYMCVALYMCTWPASSDAPDDAVPDEGEVRIMHTR